MISIIVLINFLQKRYESEIDMKEGYHIDVLSNIQFFMVVCNGFYFKVHITFLNQLFVLFCIRSFSCFFKTFTKKINKIIIILFLKNKTNLLTLKIKEGKITSGLCSKRWYGFPNKKVFFLHFV